METCSHPGQVQFHAVGKAKETGRTSEEPGPGLPGRGPGGRRWVGAQAAGSHSTSRAHPCLDGSFQPLLTVFATPGKCRSVYISKGMSVWREVCGGGVHMEGVYMYLCPLSD